MNKNPIITSINDYIIKVEGNYNYKYGEIFLINKKSLGFVISAEKQQASLIVDGDLTKIEINTEVTPLATSFKTKTGAHFFNNVIDIYGNIVQLNNLEKKVADLSKDFLKAQNSVFKIAPSMEERLKLNEPLHTGVFVLDTLIPIGKGQKQLIIGDARTGKTSLALSTISSQKNKDTKIVYASIGLKNNALKDIVKTLVEQHIFEKTIVVHSPSDSPFQQYFCPYVAMAQAENLMQEGYDVLVVLDNLTNHANILREISLLTQKPVGKEAYPGDLFYAHSSLLERAGKFLSGKSITCLPIANTINNDVTSLLISNLISITDGQIILNSELKNKGIMPAIDINLSVSRTGSSVQNISLAKVSSKLNKIHRLYNFNQKFGDTKFEFSKEVTEIMNKGKLFLSVAKQAEFYSYSYLYELILSYIIIYDLVDYKQPNLMQKFKFLYWALHNDFEGIETLKYIEQKSKTNDPVDENLLRKVLARLLKDYEKFEKKDFVFNDGKMQMSNRLLKTIGEKLW